MSNIDSLLSAANGRRRTRTLSRAEVERLVDRVVGNDQCGWSYDHGGEVANAYGQPAATTVAMVARVKGKVYLGIAACAATSVTPGRGWKCLQPFGRGDMTARLQKWTKEPNVIEIEVSAVPTPVPAEAEVGG